MLTAEIQTADVAYFQRKIQLSRLSAYPDGSPSQLIRISGVFYCRFVSRRQSGQTPAAVSIWSEDSCTGQNLSDRTC